MKTTSGNPRLPEPQFDRRLFLQLRDLVWQVPVPPIVAAYAVRVCGSSRPVDRRATPFAKDYVSWGAGPRGSQYLVLAAKARALLDGRTAPTIEDVQSVALPVLRHRIIVNHRAVGDNVKPDDVIEQLLKQVAA